VFSHFHKPIREESLLSHFSCVVDSRFDGLISLLPSPSHPRELAMPLTPFPTLYLPPYITLCHPYPSATYKLPQPPLISLPSPYLIFFQSNIARERADTSHPSLPNPPTRTHSLQNTPSNSATHNIPFTYPRIHPPIIKLFSQFSLHYISNQ
jgi:hypothetical protein